MNRLYYFLISGVVLMLLSACPYGYKYNVGKFPSEPVNLAELNSIYDDYNMASPVIENNRFLYFSSNRNSYGGDFDIVGNNVHVQWDKDEGTLQVNDDNHHWKDFRYVDTLFSLMNTSSNEFGPYSLPYHTYEEGKTNYSDVVIFSNDESGDLELKLVSFKGKGENPGPFDGEYSGPLPVKCLNSAADDAYPSFYGPGFINFEYGSEPANITEVYLCSDRRGSFDILYADVPPGGDILEFLLSESTYSLTAADVLNSDAQDKCPYIDGNLLVFASDRPGGFGGFDLYYSRRTGDTWSEPVNFGQKINTEYDEYRPITIIQYEFDQDLMLFSSNRSGGKGGFDLYYVGIPKMIE